jgi:hypothetical protein
MSSLTQIIEQYKSGENLEAIIPDGADLEWWEQNISQLVVAQANPSRRRNGHNGHPQKRINYAEQVTRRSTVDVLLNDPMWSVESAAGFTAEVARNDGSVSYTDHKPATPTIEWSELRKLAWRNGRPTHHVNQATFYRQVPGGIEVCEWDGQGFSDWRRHWAGLPEMAEPI